MRVSFDACFLALQFDVLALLYYNLKICVLRWMISSFGFQSTWQHCLESYPPREFPHWLSGIIREGSEQHHFGFSVFGSSFWLNAIITAIKKWKEAKRCLCLLVDYDGQNKRVFYRASKKILPFKYHHSNVIRMKSLYSASQKRGLF